MESHYAHWLGQDPFLIPEGCMTQMMQQKLTEGL